MLPELRWHMRNLRLLSTRTPRVLEAEWDAEISSKTAVRRERRARVCRFLAAKGGLRFFSTWKRHLSL